MLLKHQTYDQLHHIPCWRAITLCSVGKTRNCPCLAKLMTEKYRTGEGQIILLHDCLYRPQRSCGKVMFLHLSVILSTGEVCFWADTPSRPHWADAPQQTPLGRPPRQTHPPGRHPPRQNPPPAPLRRRPLQRTVRILLEWILVVSNC